ncbi:Dbl homology domain-containing protein [Pilobolus umbonatus]|nr:Dbl homology domain-containing protein [Pilobolus umbonatus]
MIPLISPFVIIHLLPILFTNMGSHLEDTHKIKAAHWVTKRVITYLLSIVRSLPSSLLFKYTLPSLNIRFIMSNSNIDDIFHISDISFHKKSHRASNPSIISTQSNMTQIFPSTEHPLNISNNKDIGQFDMIDSLDYDDVDDGLIDQEMIHRYREKIIRELYDEEKKYVDTLDFLVHSIIIPLRNNIEQPTFNFLGLKKAPCTQQELKWLFCNLDDIHQLHQKIIVSFHERLTIWGPTQIISDVMQRWFSKLQNLYQIYMDNYDLMIATYDKLSKHQPFKKFVETIEKNGKIKGINLLQFLKTPLQFMPRCSNTINLLSDNTSPMHPDYVGLLQCKQRIHQIFNYLKYKMDDVKNINEVYSIHQSMIGQPFSFKSDRRLILRDDIPRGNNKYLANDRVHYLFTDIIVIARKKFSTVHYKGHLLIDSCYVRALSPAEIDGEDFCIEINTAPPGIESIGTTFVGNPAFMIIHAGNRENQMKWLRCLEDATNRVGRLRLCSSSSSSSNHMRSTSNRRQSTSVSSDSSKSISSRDNRR